MELGDPAERPRSKVAKLYNAKKRGGGAGDYQGRSPGPGGVGRAAFPLGRRFPLCLAFLSAPHFLDAAILSSSAGRGNKGAAAMSDAGILYPRLSHMADSRGAGHPPAPAEASEAAPLAPAESWGPLKHLRKACT